MAQGRDKAEAAELSNIPSVVQRRLLRFVNAARIPEDLLRSPQQTRDTVGEHGRGHGGGDDEEGDGEEGGEHGHSGAPRLDRDLATEIIRRRPPLGYVEIDPLLAFERDRILDWLRELLRRLRAEHYGEWSEPIPIVVAGSAIAIQNAALLHTGKVLLIPSSTDTLLWNPAGAPAFTLKNSAATGLAADLFCSGHSFLPDGTLLVAGGCGASIGTAQSQQGWKFDPAAETWQRTTGDMNYKRWYPTVVTLGDDSGRALVASGWMTGSRSTPSQMEIYSATSDDFTPVTASGPVGEKRFPQTYPGMHLLPSGEVFYAPVGFGDCSQVVNPDPATESSGYFALSSAVTGAWTDTGANVRTKGMSVLLLQPTYPFVRVLVVGGGDTGASATGRLIDLSMMSPVWEDPFPLLESRVHPGAVLLPDGTVFICGGKEETGMPATGGRCEMYDPGAGTLTEMDELHYPRHYHSVALLLPSGQVMAAGGASPGGCSLSTYNTIEVFSPPYLFRGARPTVSGVPGRIYRGGHFKIKTHDPCAIKRVVLVRPMAVTHQTDSAQRVVSLAFEPSGKGKLKVTAPGGVHPEGLAPCGYYMLFVVDHNGVPSVGEFVRLC